jgi:hypothetical protein
LRVVPFGRGKREEWWVHPPLEEEKDKGEKKKKKKGKGKKSLN